MLTYAFDVVSAEIVKSQFARLHRVISDCNVLDLIEGNLILPAIIQFGRARRLVVGNLLRDFERAAVFEVRGDAGGAERGCWRKPV